MPGHGLVVVIARLVVATGAKWKRFDRPVTESVTAGEERALPCAPQRGPRLAKAGATRRAAVFSSVRARITLAMASLVALLAVASSFAVFEVMRLESLSAQVKEIDAATTCALLFAAALVLSVVVMVLLDLQVSVPVRSLEAAARKLGDGDHATRVPAEGQHELASLARHFNEMASELQERER